MPNSLVAIAARTWVAPLLVCLVAAPSLLFGQPVSRDGVILKRHSKPDTWGPGALRIRDLANPTYHDCGNATTCTVPVSVVVDAGDPQGKKCTWDFPDIVVVRKNGAVVTWKIDTGASTAGTKFSKKQNNPGTGVDLKLGQVAQGHYKFQSHTDTEFVWKRDSGFFRVIFYDFNVEHNHGSGKKCDPPDPIIVNTN